MQEPFRFLVDLAVIDLLENKTLKKKECSLRELETKLNTNYLTIRRHCEELEYLGHIKVIEHEANDKNGRPYKTVRLIA